MTKGIRRQGLRPRRSETALSGAIHAQTTREYLIGFEPDFDGRDDGIVTQIVLGNKMRLVKSPRAGDYWEGITPVDGGIVKLVIRGLPASFKPQHRNVFQGLTRIARKRDVRNGETMIVTIRVSAMPSVCCTISPVRPGCG